MISLNKKLVLFVCVENSFRSQIAEAYFNRYAPEGWKADSAGIRPALKIHPKAVRLMCEEGIDISQKKPKILTKELQEKAELTVIVCDGSACPLVHVKKVEEWGIPDPAYMSLEEARKVRDDIKRRVLNLIDKIRGEGFS